MKRIHAMPFGARCLEGGGVEFRLWAPAAHDVSLVLDGDAWPMNSAGRGWYRLCVSSALHGARYRFRIDGGHCVPDPASRFNPDDVHGPSEVIDPGLFDWQDDGWHNRPWHEAVIYELHVGAFTGEGTFLSAIARLDYLAELGISAIELMPVADFPGRRGWGYDGVLLYAPDAAYGRPDDFKLLVQEAHARGLMVVLDVVYNHLGPEGNYLPISAPEFFSNAHRTPWGQAVDLANPMARSFFIHNALYWLEEYHLDGLRLDAVHAIDVRVREGFLKELADTVHRGPGRQRPIHLLLENDANEARLLERDNGCPRWFTAQWNDDVHHALHCLLTGEASGYYADYAGEPDRHLARSLAEGFAWQGEPSHYRSGKKRGESSGHLPSDAFVSFLQNHDQVGNRAGGERLHMLAQEDAVRAALAILLLAPAPPLLFMGEEFGARTPFHFFCDLSETLHRAVRDGRRRVFERLGQAVDAGAGVPLPDPADPAVFAASRLDWGCLARTQHAGWIDFYRTLLALRRREIVPRIEGSRGLSHETPGAGTIQVGWRLGDGSILTLLANLHGAADLAGIHLAGERSRGDRAAADAELAPWSVVWFLGDTRLYSLGTVEMAWH